MLSFCDCPIVGYDLADVTIDQLPANDVVRILSHARHSRRAAKVSLHRLGLPSTSADLDVALDAIRRRPDFAELQKKADVFAYRIERKDDDVAFDALGDLRRQLRLRMETAEMFAARVAGPLRVDVTTVCDILEGKIDPPASLLLALLGDAGAQHVTFRPVRPDDASRARD